MFDMVLIFRFGAARRLLDSIRKLAPRARVVLHTSDLHFLREEREAELRGDPRVQGRATRMKRDELSVIGRMDCTIVHSTYERDLLAREAPGARVSFSAGPSTSQARTCRIIRGATSPLSAAISIRPMWTERCSSRARSCRCRQTPPDVRFHIVGSNPTAELRALHGEAVSVTGFIPDLGRFLDGVRLSVAPLRYGAGIKGKIGTSLSHGVPCVATPIAAEGMPLVDGPDVLVAETPEDFAAAVVRAYSDRDSGAGCRPTGWHLSGTSIPFEGAAVLFGELLQSLGLIVSDAPAGRAGA